MSRSVDQVFAVPLNPKHEPPPRILEHLHKLACGPRDHPQPAPDPSNCLVVARVGRKIIDRHDYWRRKPSLIATT
jgi:hypothetical protein